MLVSIEPLSQQQQQQQQQQLQYLGRELSSYGPSYHDHCRTNEFAHDIYCVWDIFKGGDMRLVSCSQSYQLLYRSVCVPHACSCSPSRYLCLLSLLFVPWSVSADALALIAWYRSRGGPVDTRCYYSGRVVWVSR